MTQEREITMKNNSYRNRNGNTDVYMSRQHWEQEYKYKYEMRLRRKIKRKIIHLMKILAFGLLMFIAGAIIF